ncbi:MAG: serine/threonine protein kinase [Myxococcales bacterium]|nr:serine/threonine protein kinase [Myxococcales bacterium]
MAAAKILGQRLANRYQVLRELSEGSTGAVYLAEDMATRKKVAVKVLIPDLSFDSRTMPHLRQRLLRRSKVVPAPGSALSHIVDITDVGVLSNDDIFVVMPHLQGDTLAALLRKRTILRWAQARTLVVTIGRLIAEYHREMLLEGSWPVLGTLQSSNCYCLRGQPKEQSIKLVNSAVDELIIRRQWRENGEHVASLARYGAPELSTGERLDVRADVYSFGVIVYELLTARVPFDDSNAARLEAMHLMSPVPPLREVAPAAKIPEALEEVILKALEKKPEARYPTMTAFVDALQAVKAKRLPAVRRGQGKRVRPRGGGRGDTMIMASPYFEGDEEGEGAAPPDASAPPGESAAPVPAASPEDDFDPEEDEGVDELAAAMEASSEDEVSGELGGDEGPLASAASTSGGSARAIIRELPATESVEGKPDVIEDGHAVVRATKRRSDTAPHAIADETQVRRRPEAPRKEEPSAKSQPPLLIRRSSVSSEGSTVRLGGAAAARASGTLEEGEAESFSADENARTARLPTVKADIESSDDHHEPEPASEPAPSGSASAPAPSGAGSSPGFGQEDAESGSSYWLWVVAALAVVAVVLYTSGGLGFITKANGPSPGAEPAPPAAAKTASDGARDLVHQARVAEQKGDHAEAYRLASASYESERTIEALEVMGRAACRLHDVDMARWIYRHLPAAARPPMKTLCDEAGVELSV